MAARRATKVASKKVGPLVRSRRKEITDLDDDFFGEVIGVAQAIGELRKALDALSVCLDRREFEKASSLGYGLVSENFVFLQRVLGGLQGACSNKERLVGEIAAATRVPYEDVLPHVDAIMKSPHPLSEKERDEARRALPKLKAKFRAGTSPRKRGR